MTEQVQIQRQRPVRPQAQPVRQTYYDAAIRAAKRAAARARKRST